jgi:hypothetical protein
MAGIQQTLQTIIALRDLQLREAAQKLSEQQLGVSRSNQQTGSIAAFQNLIQGVQNPQTLSPYVGEFQQSTGLTPDMLNTLIGQTPPAAATTRGAALASGARQLGGSQDVAAATTELTGMTPGAAARDRTSQAIYEHIPEYFQNLPPEEQQRVGADIIQQIASGQDVGSAAMSRITKDFIERAPKEVRDQIVEIGRGLAPGASEEAQLQLGYARYRLDERQTEMSLGFEDLRTRAALQEASSRLSKSAFDAATSLIEKRADFMANAARTSATLTKEGRQSYAEQLNAFNEQLRQVAPEIYGAKGTHPLTDVKPGASVGATGLFPFLGAYLSGRR